MHSDTGTTPDPKQLGGDQIAVVCRLPPDEHRRFAIAAERHGAGSTAGQMRVLIRAWMRSLNEPDLQDVAA